MVQTRSQAKTTTRTTSKSTPATKNAKSLAKRKATAPPFKAPSIENDSEAPVVSTLTDKATKGTSTTKPTRAVAVKKGRKKDEAELQRVLPAVATKSEPLKSSLQEAPRRGRKKAVDNKIIDKTEVGAVSEIQEPVEAETNGKDSDVLDSVHIVVKENIAGPGKVMKKAEDASLKSKTVASTTKQTEKRGVPDKVPSVAIATSITGRGRRAAKTQYDTSAGIGNLGGRRNARLTPANVPKAERSGNSQKKETEAHVQLHEGMHTRVPEKLHRRQKQVAPEKASAKGASVASKRQKLRATTVDDTKTTTKPASKPVKASSRKDVSVAAIAPILSYIERTEHRDIRQPASPLLHTVSRQNPLKQNTDESPLKNAPRSPVKMLMAITPAKRSNDETLEDEDDEENDVVNHVDKEWENIRNIALNSIKRSPARMITTQGPPADRSSLREKMKNIGNDLCEEDGDETDPETEEEEDEEKEKEMSEAAKSFSSIRSGNAETMDTSIEDPVAFSVARTSNPAPTPLTFKPSSLRFLTSLTPMFPADETSEAVRVRHYKNSISEKRHQSGKLKVPNHCASSLATAPQACKSNRSLMSPSKLVGVAASLFRTPFSASTQPLNPFQPASHVKKTTTFADANLDARTNVLNATSTSAQTSRNAKHGAPTSIPTSLFKSIMRVPSSTNDMLRVPSVASISSEKVREGNEISPVLTPISPQSPVCIGLGAHSFAPSTPSVRTPRRFGTEPRNEQKAQVSWEDAATHLPLSQLRNVPMTEPPAPRPILKSALKMPASSKISTPVAVNKIKKLKFLDEKKRVMTSEDKDKIVREVFDDRGSSIVSDGMEITPVRRTVSPAKTVTFESPNPLLETPTITKGRRQPMAATAEEAYEHMEEMDTAEEVFARDVTEGGARDSLAGSISGQILSGAVFYVDVNSADGADAADIFIPLLTEMGATCVPGWQNSLDGITHVLFKDGQRKTLEKVAASRGKIKCVNIGWPLEYVMQPT